MGFLELNAGALASTNKAIISLWFRVPQATIDAVHASVGPFLDDTKPFMGLIPLLILGPSGSFKRLNRHNSLPYAVRTWFRFNPGDTPELETALGFTPYRDVFNPVYDIYEEGEQVATLPSMLGVDVTGDPALFINLQTNQLATYDKVNYIVTNIEPATSYVYVNGGDPPPPNVNAVYTYEDVSMFGNETEVFRGASGAIPVTPGVWHHVLLSFDLQDIGAFAVWPDENALHGITSASEMWLAFDDVNKTGPDLSDNWVGGEDLNTIVTKGALDVAGDQAWPGGNRSGGNGNAPDEYGLYQYNAPPAGTPTMSLTSPSLPLNTAKAGIPAHSAHVDNIYLLEMAHLQVWLGQSLDFGIEINRRLFIDADGKSVDPAGAAEVLGPPDISFHAGTDWIAGTNTGTAGNFTPYGTILKSGPDPQLGT